MNPQDMNTVQCQRCGVVVHLDPAVAVMYLFLKQPWVSYWMVICPRCHQPMRCFIRDNLQWEHEWAERNDIGIITEDFPSADELSGFEACYGLNALAEHELTPYEEKEVAFFEWILNRDHYEKWWEEMGDD